MFGIIMIPWHSLIRVDVPVFGVNILPSAFKVDHFSLIFFFTIFIAILDDFHSLFASLNVVKNVEVTF